MEQELSTLLEHPSSPSHILGLQTLLHNAVHLALIEIRTHNINNHDDPI
jgi:hypothetical protein